MSNINIYITVKSSKRVVYHTIFTLEKKLKIDEDIAAQR